MKAAEIDGRIIEYDMVGPPYGSVLAFSNSLGTDPRVWDPLLEHLPAGISFLLYSTAGHGLSDSSGERPIESHARDLLALFDRLEIEQAFVAGLSVGGMIALALAEAAPSRVAGLILCCTAHRIGTADLWNERIAAVRAGGMEAVAEGVLERWFSAKFRQENPQEMALWRNMLLRTPVEGYTQLSAAIRDADLTDAARGVRVPTLCIAGSEDGSTPPEVVRGMAELISGARFETIEGSGHIPCVQEPAALGKLMGGFLQDYVLA